MENIGKYLKNFRIEKGLSIEEISDKTKIQTHVIERIEKGELEFIGGEGYIRMMLLSIARSIGVDENNFLRFFSENYRADKPVKTTEKKRYYSKPQRFSLKNILSVFIIIVTISALIYLLTVLYNQNSQTPDPAEFEHETEQLETPYPDEDGLTPEVPDEHYNESDLPAGTDNEQIDLSLQIIIDYIITTRFSHLRSVEFFDYVEKYVFDGTGSPLSIISSEVLKD